MDKLIAPKVLKLGIFRCLKAGLNPEFPEQGTPQGGVCSPLLANIALNGIEDCLPSSHGRIVRDKKGRNPRRGVSAVRYADDMVFVLKDTGNEIHNLKQEAELIDAITKFLAERGMELSQEKTKLTKPTQGFDFLGWHFKIQTNKKIRITPSKENYLSFKKKIKALVNSSNMGATEKAKKLAPIVRGWRNYHKYCKMDGARNSLYHTEHRAYKVFNKETRQNRQTSKLLVGKAFPPVSYSEGRYAKVKGDKSPFDGDFIYWSKRESKSYNGHTSKALKKQSHKCGYCYLSFLPGEAIHLHHKDNNHSNWKSNNLVAIHRSCHQYIHMKQSKS